MEMAARTSGPDRGIKPAPLSGTAGNPGCLCRCSLVSRLTACPCWRGRRPA